MVQSPIFFVSSMIMILQCLHARHGSRILRLLDPLARMTGVLIEPVSHDGHRSIMSLTFPFIHRTVKYGTDNKKFFGQIRMAGRGTSETWFTIKGRADARVFFGL